MRHRIVLVAAVVAALTLAGSAAAFDCIRVSSSLQGLQASTKSGKWFLFDFSSGAAVQRTLASIGEPVPSDGVATCMASHYGASGQPLYFAIGIGVAGPNGVLAHRNPTGATSDGRGIDHLEQTGIFPAMIAAAIACGYPVT